MTAFGINAALNGTLPSRVPLTRDGRAGGT
jgi:hypothetical protein